jgi:hypothetical protein
MTSGLAAGLGHRRSRGAEAAAWLGHGDRDAGGGGRGSRGGKLGMAREGKALTAATEGAGAITAGGGWGD